ncbi:cytochrome c oxidase subunit 6C-like [Euwallacea fornicatus]|uniref:cytochrome c oxidase subunit 6C-like n=1 Tax=Euwallacea fornicatus TaxID=995702 RepID=UPI00338EC254
MTTEIAKLPKPQLRHLLHNTIKKNLILVGISITVVAAYVKYVHNDGRKQRYADFYKTYDIEKEFNIMRKKGLFDSCPIDN